MIDFGSGFSREDTENSSGREWLKAVVAERLLACILDEREEKWGGQWGRAGTQRHQHSETQTHQYQKEGLSI